MIHKMNPDNTTTREEPCDECGWRDVTKMVFDPRSEEFRALCHVCSESEDSLLP